MPLPIFLSHRLVERQAELRRSGKLPWLRPDAKSQVTIRYLNGKPESIDTVVLSTQHAPGIEHKQLSESVIEEVIKPVLPRSLVKGKVSYLVNPTGAFEIGGPKGDCGVTGRKIIVDTYGGSAPHGGGAFSGKDPSKVDRSAAYAARYVAKNIVAAGLAARCLEEVLKAAGDTVRMLRNSQIGAYVYPVVPGELSNWRDEQAAWQKSAVLFDQSHHMVEQYVEGPDALKLFTHLGGNSFANFAVDRAKQFAPTSYDGYVIGDGILFHLAQESLVFVGRAPAASWIQFHAETGGYDVVTHKDDRSPGNTKGNAIVRRNYRFQIQGPNAWKVIEKLNGGPVPEIKFFNMGRINIA